MSDVITQVIDEIAGWSISTHQLATGIQFLLTASACFLAFWNHHAVSSTQILKTREETEQFLDRIHGRPVRESNVKEYKLMHSAFAILLGLIGLFTIVSGIVLAVALLNRVDQQFIGYIFMGNLSIGLLIGGMTVYFAVGPGSPIWGTQRESDLSPMEDE